VNRFIIPCRTGTFTNLNARVTTRFANNLAYCRAHRFDCGLSRAETPHPAIDHVVIRGEFLQPGADPITPRRGNRPELAGADHLDGPPSPISQHA
jgi:hypothetical protein